MTTRRKQKIESLQVLQESFDAKNRIVRLCQLADGSHLVTKEAANFSKSFLKSQASEAKNLFEELLVSTQNHE
jgi:hypothetical protein